MLVWKQFCFAVGVMIRQERRAARSRATGKRLDAPGVRRPKIHPNRLGRFKLPVAASRDRWAGAFCGKSIGPLLARTTSPCCAAFLDLAAKPLRQYDSIQA